MLSLLSTSRPMLTARLPDAAPKSSAARCPRRRENLSPINQARMPILIEHRNVQHHQVHVATHRVPAVLHSFRSRRKEWRRRHGCRRRYRRRQRFTRCLRVSDCGQRKHQQREPEPFCRSESPSLYPITAYFNYYFAHARGQPPSAAVLTKNKRIDALRSAITAPA